MIWNWMTFGLDAARLGRETQEVMALRFLKLARGGHAAEVEVDADLRRHMRADPALAGMAHRIELKGDSLRRRAGENTKL